MTIQWNNKDDYFFTLSIELLREDVEIYKTANVLEFDLKKVFGTL